MGSDIVNALQKNPQVTSCCCGTFIAFLTLFLATCWGMVQPTEFGLRRSMVTGTVDLTNVYQGGRHFLGWGNEFIHFPSKWTSMTLVVQARTGPGVNDNSGGQPVTLDVSFQYRFRREQVPQVYRSFGLNYETSYRRFAAQAITNAAQRFTPFAFWQIRASVEHAIRVAVTSTLQADGYAEVEQLQLVAVSFQPQYEATITNIQLQEQLGVTRRFQLQVTAVEQSIAVLQAQTDAQVNAINAAASRASAVIRNVATNDALLREQAAKADMYAQIRGHLNWTQPQFLEYIRQKALNGQPAQANIKVAMGPVGSSPVPVIDGTGNVEPGSG